MSSFEPFFPQMCRTFSSRDIFYQAATNKIAALLLEAINATQKATLLCSGGSTPGPVYDALSELDLPWNNVSIGLVDERWVDVENAGSNAALLHKYLLKNMALSAKLVPMKTGDDTPQKAQARVGADYKRILSNQSVAVLGMGTDGHVCSWFPKADGLGPALDPSNDFPVQGITAQKSNVTGDYLHRMTLTYSAIATCRAVILLITGAEKKAVIDSVLAGDAPHLPVAHLLALKPNQLSILYTP